MSEFLSSDVAYERSTSIEEIELPDGTKAKVEVRDATLDEIEKFEKREAEGEHEISLVQEIFDEYLVRPGDLDATKMPMPKVNCVFKGVLKAWGVEEDDLDKFIDEREGN